MNRFARLSSAALGLALASFALADGRTTQVNIEVRFLEVTSEALRDLGADIGFGGGLSVNFISNDRASGIPFLAASWDRMTGDNDFEMTMTGLLAGYRFRLTPNKPLNESQSSIVVGVGHFENKHKDQVADEKEKGVGFDIGIEVGPAANAKSPLFRFLYSRRPDTFGKQTQLMIITAALPINVGK